MDGEKGELSDVEKVQQRGKERCRNSETEGWIKEGKWGEQRGEYF